jgi:hypothetical protein
VFIPRTFIALLAVLLCSIAQPAWATPLSDPLDLATQQKPELQGASHFTLHLGKAASSILDDPTFLKPHSIASPAGLIATAPQAGDCLPD